MKKTWLLFLLWGRLLGAWAQSSPHWLRYPAISPDGKTIVFTYHGDLYKVAAGGGEAVPLVMQAAHELMPVWSHDGRYIAYASDRQGNYDVFIVPVTGGTARQLTWYSGDEFPTDLSADNKTVFFSSVRMDAPANRQFPSDGLPELYAVPAAGGRSRQVLTTPAEAAKVSKNGRYIVYHDRKGRENPWRKHQTSSIARDIWLYDTVVKSHRLLSSFAGEDRNPVFAADHRSVFFLSERQGSFNVYQQSLTDTASARPVTRFRDHPIRFLSIARNNTLCFGYDGQVFIQRPGAEAVKVAVRLPGMNKKDTLHQVTVDEAQEMAVAPSGREVAFVFRGEVFVSNVHSKMIRRITHTAGEERGLQFSPDGKKLLYASERNNRWEIYEAVLAGVADSLFTTASSVKESKLIANDRENYQPLYSPDGRAIAFIENRTTLSIYDIASGATRRLLTGAQLVSRRDHDQYFNWSPDGQWLLIQFVEPGSGNEEVGIVRADGNGRLINVTQSGFSDLHPAWAMGGRMITWYSDRQGLHSYAHSSTRQQDVYAVFTDAAARDSLRDDKTTIADTVNNTITKGVTDWAQVDWATLREKKERLTTQSTLLADALVSKDGHHLYMLSKVDKQYDLYLTNLRTGQNKLLVRLGLKEGSMQWDRAQEYIFLLSDGKIFRVDPIQVKVDTIATHMEFILDLAEERASLFEHIWRSAAGTFYTAGMHGIDWNGLKRAYTPYLEGINNNYDLAEMLNELLGELNVSHTGVTYTPSRKNATVTGSLGVFYDAAYMGVGMRIAELMPGGPLDRWAGEVKAGTVIEAIDGERVAPDRDIAQYLNGKAGKNTRLLIRNGEATRELTVQPASPAEEAELLYRRWVKRNVEETAVRSKGRIGYVHLYRMNDAAYRNVYEEVMGRYATCDAIIVDTRFNRGGDLAPELVAFLSGVKVRENASDRFMVGKEPSFRWTKPSIVLANEANYSDGHCFVYDYQYLRMGKLVGMPVPGSCTWMTGQTLWDPSLNFSVPTLGVRTLSGRYLENCETEPDIRVMNEYGPVSEGRDQQLEAAIEALMNDLITNR